MYPVTITGAKVMLRELAEGDAAALHRVYGDPEVTEHLSFTPRTLEQVNAIIGAAVTDAAAAEPRQVYMLAVAVAGTGELIGSARLGLGDYESAVIGFALHPGWWGKGAGTETVRLLQRLAFGGLGLHRVWGARAPGNVASARTMSRAGMTEEGLIRGHVKAHGAWRDSVAHSVLADEWEQEPGV